MTAAPSSPPEAPRYCMFDEVRVCECTCAGWKRGRCVLDDIAGSLWALVQLGNSLRMVERGSDDDPPVEY